MKFVFPGLLHRSLFSYTNTKEKTAKQFLETRLFKSLKLRSHNLTFTKLFFCKSCRKLLFKLCWSVVFSYIVFAFIFFPHCHYALRINTTDMNTNKGHRSWSKIPLSHYISLSIPATTYISKTAWKEKLQGKNLGFYCEFFFAFTFHKPTSNTARVFEKCLS